MPNPNYTPRLRQVRGRNFPLDRNSKPPARGLAPPYQAQTAARSSEQSRGSAARRWLPKSLLAEAARSHKFLLTSYFIKLARYDVFTTESVSSRVRIAEVWIGCARPGCRIHLSRCGSKLRCGSSLLPLVAFAFQQEWQNQRSEFFLLLPP